MSSGGRKEYSGKGYAADARSLVERERERMIHERQEVVSRVLDEHDNLVRSHALQPFPKTNTFSG